MFDQLAIYTWSANAYERNLKSSQCKVAHLKFGAYIMAVFARLK